jgi:hypothetical protein
MSDQIVDALFENDENYLQRKSRENATHRADERASESHIAVYQRHHAKPRIGLDNLDIHALFAEKSFAHRHVIWDRSIAPAGNRDSDFLGLRDKRCSRPKGNAEKANKRCQLRILG